MTAGAAPAGRILLVWPENGSAREERLARAWGGGGLLVLAPEPEKVRAAPDGATLLGWQALAALPARERPDAVVYASPPPLALHWRVWRWQRRRAPGALLGGFWKLPSVGSSSGGMRRWLAARAWDSLDFWLAEDDEDAAALARAGAAPARILTLDGAETPAAFLARRRRAEEHSVLWVDDDLSLQSPSTKHLVSSLPHLRATGWEVRGWCLTADADARAGSEIRTFPPPPRALRLFTPYWFFARANLHGLGRALLKGRPPARVVQSIGSAYLGADLAAVHFVHHLWLRKQLELGPRSRREYLELGWTALAMCRDQLQYLNPRCRGFLPVSDSIARAVRGVCRPGATVEVLPNSYDETRFNPAVRARWRAPMRRELGFADGDPVFCFASQGHYRRKGFWLAVDALARLRARPGVPLAPLARLLVVGGAERTLGGVRAELTQTRPGWAAWITFVGTQAEVERYLSAADAFLFPSYFEAFCLAEIEAGALGLPLLLTPHPGTEMILRPGENGLLLSDDPARLADQLADFLARGLPPFAASPGRALTRDGYARALAARYEEILHPTHDDPTPP